LDNSQWGQDISRTWRTTKERAEQDVHYTKELWEEEEKALAEMDA